PHPLPSDGGPDGPRPSGAHPDRGPLEGGRRDQGLRREESDRSARGTVSTGPPIVDVLGPLPVVLPTDATALAARDAGRIRLPDLREPRNLGRGRCVEVGHAGHRRLRGRTVPSRSRRMGRRIPRPIPSRDRTGLFAVVPMLGAAEVFPHEHAKVSRHGGSRPGIRPDPAAPRAPGDGAVRPCRGAVLSLVRRSEDPFRPPSAPRRTFYTSPGIHLSKNMMETLRERGSDKCLNRESAPTADGNDGSARTAPELVRTLRLREACGRGVHRADPSVGRGRAVGGRAPRGEADERPRHGGHPKSSRRTPPGPRPGGSDGPRIPSTPGRDGVRGDPRRGEPQADAVRAADRPSVCAVPGASCPRRRGAQGRVLWLDMEAADTTDDTIWLCERLL